MSWVHPEMAAILASAPPAPDYQALPLADARPIFERMNAPWNENAPALPEIRDLAIPTKWGTMAARLFRPSLAAKRPCVVFVHGGGWTFGSIETHRGAMARLAIESGACVLGFDYRLAPEHPFPAAIKDTQAALDALAGGIAGDAVDASRLALAGDSAGAAISLLTAATTPWKSRLRAMALFYGCYLPVFDTASHRAYGTGYGLTTARMRWYWGNWRGPAALPDLAGMPAAYLNAAALDPLCCETLDLASVLAGAGNDVKLDLHAGVIHGFMQMSAKLEPARAAHKAAGKFLSEKLE
ncbi:MAG: alpha/beta hydrolase [Tagaea sp.]